MVMYRPTERMLKAYPGVNVPFTTPEEHAVLAQEMAGKIDGLRRAVEIAHKRWLDYKPRTGDKFSTPRGKRLNAEWSKASETLKYAIRKMEGHAKRAAGNR